MEQMPLRLDKIIVGIGVVLVLALAASMLWGWYKAPPLVNPVQYTPAPEIRETIKIKRVEVPGPKEIITIEKEIIVEKLKLPDEIGKNPDKQIIATAEIAAYEGKTDAIAILDTKTGEGSISIKQEPLPLFAFKNQKEMGGRGGIVSGIDGTRYQVDVYGRYTFLRIGRIHTALYGEVNSCPEGKAMIDISYRWGK